MAFGVNRWPHEASSPFGNWKLLVLAALSLLLLRFLVRLEINWPTTLTAIGTGTLWGWLIDWRGILMPTALVLLLMVVASSASDRIRYRPN